MKEEYDKIVAQIRELQERKAELEKVMIESNDSFIEKFKLWYNSEDEGFYQWLVDTPRLRALFDEIDTPRRGQTYELYDLVDEDDFWAFMEGEEDDEYFNLADFLNKYQPALEEAMENNIKSFKCDW